ncbi:hypothetical protein GCM10010252_73570 [Streptomyces aureoverticillatus]|nr:hypothetical protein GCM10010252_73570 [Streptomyces aureoverticillatus]
MEDGGVGFEGVVGFEAGEGLGDAGQVVVGGVDAAGGVGEGLEAAGQPAGADPVGGGLDGIDGAVAGGGRGQAARDEGGGVVAGDRAGWDAQAGGQSIGGAVEAEESPVVLVGVVGDEVPQPAGVDQVTRLDAAPRGDTVTAGVVEGGDLVVAAGNGEGGQQAGVDARPVFLLGDAGEGLLKGGGPAAQAAGKDLFQLGQGS